MAVILSGLISMEFVGCVTARLNSKRVPQKNIIKIGGKTLLTRAINTLNEVNQIKETYLYASQKKIINYVDNSVKFKFLKRGKYLDGDYITFKEVLTEFCKEISTDYIVLLHCTSPFIKSDTIKEMIKKIKTDDFDSAFAATEIKNYCWYKNKPLNFDLDNLPRTQEIEPIIVETSSLYIFKKAYFQKTKRRTGKKPYIKKIGLFEGWDIDWKEDVIMAEMIQSRINKIL